MSDSSASSSLQPSSELVRWLQSLALPLWARGTLVIVFLAVMTGGLALVVWGAWNRDREAMTAAIGLLTVALPVSLVVIGLVFGQRSERRLAQLTHAVLDVQIPAQVQQLEHLVESGGVGAPGGADREDPLQVLAAGQVR